MPEALVRRGVDDPTLVIVERDESMDGVSYLMHAYGHARILTNAAGRLGGKAYDRTDFLRCWCVSFSVQLTRFTRPPGPARSFRSCATSSSIF
jgi:hypothetical protein